MPNIDFYNLKSTTHKMDRFVCRLVDKIYTSGHQVHVCVEDNAEAKAYDDLLWTFQKDSFLPHQVLEADQKSDCPIVIGTKDQMPAHFNVLINLSSEVPEFYNQFSRVLEVITQDEKTLQKTRKNYRFYQKNGYDIRMHEIKASTKKSA